MKCFIGYPFIYEHNSFIASLALHEKQDCLSVLYQHLPNILEVRLDNQEEWKKPQESVCKISGKMKLATTVFVVAFWYAESKEKPRARRGEGYIAASRSLMFK